MADLGTVGVNGLATKETLQGQAWFNAGAVNGLRDTETMHGPRFAYRGFHIVNGPISGTSYGQAPAVFPINPSGPQSPAYTLFLRDSGRNNIEGNPAQPSLVMNARGTYTFRWAVQAGARAIQVNVKHPEAISGRPYLRVRANPEIGVNADAFGLAPSGPSWVTIGPVMVTPTSAGALFVDLERVYDGVNAPCYWDHPAIS